MIVERSGNRHVGLDVREACSLQRSVRRDVEGVRLAEEALELEPVEVKVDGQGYALATGSASYRMWSEQRSRAGALWSRISGRGVKSAWGIGRSGRLELYRHPLVCAIEPRPGGSVVP